MKLLVAVILLCMPAVAFPHGGYADNYWSDRSWDAWYYSDYNYQSGWYWGAAWNQFWIDTGRLRPFGMGWYWD